MSDREREIGLRLEREGREHTTKEILGCYSRDEDEERRGKHAVLEGEYLGICLERFVQQIFKSVSITIVQHPLKG